MLEIISVDKNSIAERVGIHEGDFLISINGNKIHDSLDLRFYQNEESLRIEISRAGSLFSYNIAKTYDEELGFKVPDIKIRSCGNDCIFCFVDQNPPGLRSSLYFHDEDYRFSFLFGQYCTLTNVGKRELERIVAQRLSPLYISIHATDLNVQKKIFQFRADDNLIEKLEFLTGHRIELHAQIVLLPGINDGEVLEKTIADLYHFRNSVKSVSIVPVGLTKYRKELPKIQCVDKNIASEIIGRLRYWNRNYFNVEGNHFVYLSDEFFLLADRRLPGRNQYGSFYQIENGVGLVRDFIYGCKSQIRKLPESIPKSKYYRFVTGILCKPILENHVVSFLNRVRNLKVDVTAVENNFFGSAITVSGLLTGRDIIEQLKLLPECDTIFLPPRCVNNDGLLLDDTTIEEIQDELGTEVKIAAKNFVKMIINDCT